MVRPTSRVVNFRNLIFPEILSLEVVSRVPTGLPKQNSLTFPDFSSQSHNISLTYIGTNFSTETAP